MKRSSLAIGPPSTPYSGPAVVIDLRARPARSGDAHRPVVVGHAAALDPLRRQPGHLLPQLDRFVVIQIDGGPESFGIHPVATLFDGIGQQRPGQLDRAAFEVVAEREVPGHLEERVVPGGDADFVDIRCADAFLDAGGRRVWRGALAEEVRHELHHARVDEQQVGVVEDHRGAGHLGVARLHEMIEETLPDLVCLHVPMSSWFFYLDRTTVPVCVAVLESQRMGAADGAGYALDVAASAAPAISSSRTDRRGLSRLRSTSTTLCQVPSSGSPALHRHRHRRRHQRRHDVVGPWPGEPWAWR